MMNEDQLIELLRNPDAAHPPPNCRDDLTQRVRAAAHRQRIVRLTGGAVAAVLIIGIGAYLVTAGTRPHANNLAQSAAPSKESSIAEAAEIAELRAELAQLRADIDEAAREIRHLNDARLEASRAVLEPTPAARLAVEFDKTAFIMLDQGDRLYRTYGLVDQAIQAYCRTIKLFPESRWADVARDRLNEIKSKKGDQL